MCQLIGDNWRSHMATMQALRFFIHTLISHAHTALLAYVRVGSGVGVLNAGAIGSDLFSRTLGHRVSRTGGSPVVMDRTTLAAGAGRRLPSLCVLLECDSMVIVVGRLFSLTKTHVTTCNGGERSHCLPHLNQTRLFPQ